MDPSKIEALLIAVRDGEVSVAQAYERMRSMPYDDIGYARLDTHRALRQGLPEVVFCQNKTIDQARGILAHLWQHHDRVLATRVSTEMAAAIEIDFPEAHYDPTSRLITLVRTALPPPSPGDPFALVVTGGTADLPVAEEAAQTAEFFGTRVERAYDVGVAGVHRLLNEFERLSRAALVISVAGMEGALTSVVAGLVACPVIGVPTSVGYGANFGGLSALLAMLNSCAPGVSVVNIDNGFGAGVNAHLILRRLPAHHES